MIALLGAGGKIGRVIAEQLQKHLPDAPIRRGCRKLPDRRQEAWRQVDIRDRESLACFLDDTGLIINAAGPSGELSGIVAEYAAAHQLPLIDVGDHDWYRENEGRHLEQPILYACGAVPGVMGLLPRFMAGDFAEVSGLAIYYSIHEAMTETAAADMTEKFRMNDQGSRPPAAVTQPEAVPFLGEQVYCYRFTDDESARVEKLCGIQSGEWYMVREQDDLERVLQENQGDRQALITALCRVSRANTQGRKSYLRFVVSMQGTDGQGEKAATCFAQSSSQSELSGKAAAAAAITVLEHQARPGLWRLACTPFWGEIWERLQKLQPFESSGIYPYPLREMGEEDGEL